MQVTDMAKVLDACHPTWYRNVDIHTLNLSSSTSCVLAQAFGSFRKGDDVVVRQTTKMGYSLWANFSSVRLICFNKYRAAWIDEITARLAQDAKPQELVTNSTHVDYIYV